MVAALPMALAVLTAGLYLGWPRALPFVVTGTVLFPVATPIAMDVAMLAGLAVGIVVDVLRDRDTAALRSASTAIWLPFVAFALVLVASAVVNQNAYDGTEHAALLRNTKWFVFRMGGVLAGLVWTAKRRGVGLDRWARALIWMALVLVTIRAIQAAGFDPMGGLDAMGVQVFSDLRVPSAYNGYASFLALVLPFAVAFALGSDRPRVGLFYWIAAFVLTAGFFEVQSRTASLIVIVELGCWFAFCKTSLARLAIVGLAVTYVGITEFDPSPIQLTTVLAHRTAPTRMDVEEIRERTGLAKLDAKGGSDPADQTLIWRSPLVHPQHRLVQRLRVLSIGEPQEVRVYLRRGRGGNTALGVRVDGGLVSAIADLPEGEFQWVSVPLPADAIHGDWVEVELEAIGELDAVKNYLEVGGMALRSPDIRSSYRNGTWKWEGDLSWDPGRQDGVFLVLLNDTGLQNAVPLPAPPPTSLDQSLSDRVELWRAAAQIAATHPWLGTGYYTFRLRSAEMLKGKPRFFEYANAHNAFLQIAADLGVFGLACFVWMFGALFRGLAVRLVATTPASPRIVALGLAVTSVLMSSMTQTWFADVRYCLSAWIVFAMAVLWLVDEPPVPELQ